jgi:hypothetical protein
MSDEASPNPPEALNYFNYFTEVEEHFQRVRGTGLFLMSPLDWALIESWKNAGIPIEAVLRGIDAAFEKWRAKKQQGRRINSLAYCTQAVTEEAQAIAKGAPSPATGEQEAPFAVDELTAHLSNAGSKLREKGFADIATTLEELSRTSADHMTNLEDLEQRLTALEELLLSQARVSLTPDQMYQHRKELDNYLRPYRSKFTADQLARLERQFLDRRLFENFSLPRLSLFYIG